MFGSRDGDRRAMVSPTVIRLSAVQIDLVIVREHYRVNGGSEPVAQAGAVSRIGAYIGVTIDVRSLRGIGHHRRLLEPWSEGQIKGPNLIALRRSATGLVASFVLRGSDGGELSARAARLADVAPAVGGLAAWRRRARRSISAATEPTECV